MSCFKKPGITAGLFCTLHLMSCAKIILPPTFQTALQQDFLQYTTVFDEFSIVSLERFKNSHSDTLHVFIEGDGLAWYDKYTPSNDPTPVNPVALRFALQDSHPNVLYVGRPCQYEPIPQCHAKYWTIDRFSTNVIEAINQVIEQRCEEHDFNQIELTGFSGGGVIAAMLASYRDDCTRLETFGSPLDTQSWTQYHAVTELGVDSDSYANALTAIPQHHHFGTKDKIVPIEVNQRYLARWCIPYEHCQVSIHKEIHHTNWLS